MNDNNQPNVKLSTHLRQTLRRLLNLLTDKAPEAETIESIKAGVDFHGAKLWILILAIFVASLGLNTNSAAVIIGAMLISPLMGPIMGMGLGAGINDFELLKRAFRSFLTATVFSVLTATVYFVITPIAEAQSELLARTSPTIYDVLIALCGGMAGIIALCSTGQRNGNVIPGVAIATALMPPLCTTGFGLATGNWAYAIGAFYLYLINTIFISLATFVGVNIMHFHKKVFVDKERERKVKRLITVVAVVTMLPASLLTYGLVRETVFTRKANQYIHRELAFEGTLVLSGEIDYAKKRIKVVLLGQNVSEKEIENARKRLEEYGLQNTELKVIQGYNYLGLQDLKSILNKQEARQSGSGGASAELLANQQQRIHELEEELAPYRRNERLATTLRRELQALFPEVRSLNLCRGIRVHAADSLPADSSTIAILTLSAPLQANEEERLKTWLQKRIDTQGPLQIILEKEAKEPAAGAPQKQRR